MKLRRISTNKSILEIGNARILFSHETPVAACLPDDPNLAYGYIVTNAKVSITTERHIREWAKEIEGTLGFEQVDQEVFDGLVQIPDAMVQ